MEGYAMREDTVVQLRQPGTFSEDPMTVILRLGARRLLAQAVEMEVTTFVEMHANLTDGAGRRRQDHIFELGLCIGQIRLLIEQAEGIGDHLAYLPENTPDLGLGQ